MKDPIMKKIKQVFHLMKIQSLWRMQFLFGLIKHRVDQHSSMNKKYD